MGKIEHKNGVVVKREDYYTINNDGYVVNRKPIDFIDLSNLYEITFEYDLPKSTSTIIQPTDTITKDSVKITPIRLLENTIRYDYGYLECKILDGRYRLQYNTILNTDRMISENYKVLGEGYDQKDYDTSGRFIMKVYPGRDYFFYRDGSHLFSYLWTNELILEYSKFLANIVIESEREFLETYDYNKTVLENQINTTNIQIANLTARVAGLRSQIDSLNRTIDELNKMDPKPSNYAELLARYQAELAAASNELTIVQSQLSTITSANANYKDKLRILNKTKHDYDNKDIVFTYLYYIVSKLYGFRYTLEYTDEMYLKEMDYFYDSTMRSASLTEDEKKECEEYSAVSRTATVLKPHYDKDEDNVQRMPKVLDIYHTRHATSRYLCECDLVPSTGTGLINYTTKVDLISITTGINVSKININVDSYQFTVQYYGNVTNMILLDEVSNDTTTVVYKVKIQVQNGNNFICNLTLYKVAQKSLHRLYLEHPSKLIDRDVQLGYNINKIYYPTISTVSILNVVTSMMLSKLEVLESDIIVI